MGLSQQREERANLVATLEQLTGARVKVLTVTERDTAVVLEGGNPKLLGIRIKAVPNEVLRTAITLEESWR